MKLKDLDLKTCKCWECGGKPDEVYFKEEMGTDSEVLSVICTGCKEACEATLRAIGQRFL